jgi:GT2 family glycosyltransferase
MQVRSLVAAAEKTGVCVCSSRYTVRGRTTVTSHGDGEIGHETAVRRVVEGAGYATPTLLVKKEVFETVGAFDESLPRLQDYEFTLRAAAGGWNFVLMPQVLVNHYINVDSISYSADNYVRALEIILDKHAGLLNRHRAGHSRLIFRGGKYLAQENRYRSALPLFWKALRTNPMNARALAGVILITTGTYRFFKRIKYGKA